MRGLFKRCIEDRRCKIVNFPAIKSSRQGSNSADRMMFRDRRLWVAINWNSLIEMQLIFFLERFCMFAMRMTCETGGQRMAKGCRARNGEMVHAAAGSKADGGFFLQTDA